jgi:hypothetical protein
MQNRNLHYPHPTNYDTHGQNISLPQYFLDRDFLLIILLQTDVNNLIFLTQCKQSDKIVRFM